jgi:ribosomal-protein-alanine N-acetyltransferase
MTRGEPLAAGREIVLRTFTREDITPDYIGWLNDPEVVTFSSQRFVVHTYESCATYHDSFAGSPNLFVAIVHKTTGRVIGTMTAYVDIEQSTADMGILIGDRSMWGTGVGTDAWSALMQYLFEHGGVKLITAGTLAENHGMRRIAEKCGMQLVGNRLIEDGPTGTQRVAYQFALSRG